MDQKFGASDEPEAEELSRSQRTAQSNYSQIALFNALKRSRKR